MMTTATRAARQTLVPALPATLGALGLRPSTVARVEAALDTPDDLVVGVTVETLASPDGGDTVEGVALGQPLPEGHAALGFGVYLLVRVPGGATVHRWVEDFDLDSTSPQYHPSAFRAARATATGLADVLDLRLEGRDYLWR